MCSICRSLCQRNALCKGFTNVSSMTLQQRRIIFKFLAWRRRRRIWKDQLSWSIPWRVHKRQRWLRLRKDFRPNSILSKRLPLKKNKLLREKLKHKITYSLQNNQRKLTRWKICSPSHRILYMQFSMNLLNNSSSLRVKRCWRRRKRVDCLDWGLPLIQLDNIWMDWVNTC